MKKSIISKTKILSLFFLSLFFVFGANSLKAEASVYSFTEDFNTNAYEDKLNTTAIWDTSSGKLELPFVEEVDQYGNINDRYVNKFQSLKINENISGKIIKVTLTEDSSEAGIGYEVSADGGLNWQNIFSGTEYYLSKPGYDLRWRGVNTTSRYYQTNGISPYIEKINISYETQDKEKGALSISRVYHGKTVRVNKDDKNILFLEIKLKADDTEDINISAITFFAQKEVTDSSGYVPVSSYVPATSNDIKSLKLYNGSTQIGIGSISNKGFITFSGFNFTIPKNSSNNLIVKGNIEKSTNAQRLITYLNSENNPKQGEWVINKGLMIKMIVSGSSTNLRPTVSGNAFGSWLFVVPDPKTYSYKFVEDFSSNTYEDIFKTTADWDLNKKEAKLKFENGKYSAEGTIQSLKINDTSKMITEAKITVDAIVDKNISTLDRQIGITYYLSADGGIHWVPVTPITPGLEYISELTFTDYPGYDLRWKADLWTNSSNSPVLNNITIDYNTVDVPINYLDVESLPVNINVEKGAKNAILNKLKLSNNTEEDFTLSGAQFYGVSSGVHKIKRSDLSSAYLYNGETKIANAYINDEMEIIFSFDSIKIDKGNSIDLIFKGDIPSESDSCVLSFHLNYISEKFSLIGVDSNKKPKIRGSGSSVNIFLFKNNTPIKSSNDTKIYILDNGEKNWIKTAEEFEQKGYDWNDIKEIDSEVVDSIPEASEPSQEIQEGSIIRANGDVDIYIVKYIGNKKFKRLILNPFVFRSYGHLKWEDVIEVEKETVDSFTTSNLVRNAITGRIYRLTANGDSGMRRHFRSISVMQGLGYDLDAVYEINATDENSYDQGEDLK